MITSRCWVCATCANYCDFFRNIKRNRKFLLGSIWCYCCKKFWKKNFDFWIKKWRKNKENGNTDICRWITPSSGFAIFNLWIKSVFTKNFLMNISTKTATVNLKELKTCLTITIFVTMNIIWWKQLIKR